MPCVTTLDELWGTFIFYPECLLAASVILASQSLQQEGTISESKMLVAATKVAAVHKNKKTNKILNH